MGWNTYLTRKICDAELELGKRATEGPKELLASGEVRVIESGKIDRYGRRQVECNALLMRRAGFAGQTIPIPPARW